MVVVVAVAMAMAAAVATATVWCPDEFSSLFVSSTA
jgi:hypothetical protein